MLELEVDGDLETGSIGRGDWRGIEGCVVVMVQTRAMPCWYSKQQLVCFALLALLFSHAHNFSSGISLFFAKRLSRVLV